MCTGCEACFIVCPSDAILRSEKIVGWTYEGSKHGIDIVTGELRLNEPEAALLVKATKERAYKKATNTIYDVIIIDTAPGAHCDVIRSLEGTDLVLPVTEPTPFGAHDLDLILKLTKMLGSETKVVLNREDIAEHKEEIMEVCNKNSSEIISSIPLDYAMLESYIKGIPAVLENPHSKGTKSLIQLSEKVMELVKI